MVQRSIIKQIQISVHIRKLLCSLIKRVLSTFSYNRISMREKLYCHKYIISFNEKKKKRQKLEVPWLYNKKNKEGYLVWNEGRKRESSLMQQIFNQCTYGKCIMGGESYFQVSWWINVWWYRKENSERLSYFWPLVMKGCL